MGEKKKIRDNYFSYLLPCASNCRLGIKGTKMPVKGSAFLAAQVENQATEGNGHVGKVTAVPESKPKTFAGGIVIGPGGKGVISVFISPPDVQIEVRHWKVKGSV